MADLTEIAREVKVVYCVPYVRWGTACPRCGSGKTRAYHTNRPPTETQRLLRRYHRCRGCGYRFSSFERLQLLEEAALA
jgi:rubredoxin